MLGRALNCLPSILWSINKTGLTLEKFIKIILVALPDLWVKDFFQDKAIDELIPRYQVKEWKILQNIEKYNISYSAYESFRKDCRLEDSFIFTLSPRTSFRY